MCNLLGAFKMMGENSGKDLGIIKWPHRQLWEPKRSILMGKIGFLM